VFRSGGSSCSIPSNRGDADPAQAVQTVAPGPGRTTAAGRITPAATKGATAAPRDAAAASAATPPGTPPALPDSAAVEVVSDASVGSAGTGRNR